MGLEMYCKKGGFMVKNGEDVKTGQYSINNQTKGGLK